MHDQPISAEDEHQAKATVELGLAAACSTLDPGSDPLDYFGAIRDLIERGMNAEERALLDTTDVEEQHVQFPSVGDQHVSATSHAELEVKKTELEEKVKALQRTLDEYRERNAKVKACSLCTTGCRHSTSCIWCVRSARPIFFSLRALGSC